MRLRHVHIANCQPIQRKQGVQRSTPILAPSGGQEQETKTFPGFKDCGLHSLLGPAVIPLCWFLAHVAGVSHCIEQHTGAVFTVVLYCLYQSQRSFLLLLFVDTPLFSCTDQDGKLHVNIFLKGQHFRY